MDKSVLVNDAKKYSSLLRNIDSVSKRMSLCEKTANLIRVYLNENGIQFEYNGTLIFLSVKIKDAIKKQEIGQRPTT